MDLNVDVIDNDTGEIYREGVLLANAHIFISQEKGKIIKDEVEILEGSSNTFLKLDREIVRNLYVEFPRERRKRDLAAEAQVRARKFWQYENGGGQVNKL
jgi:hypothetical protein